MEKRPTDIIYLDHAATTPVAPEVVEAMAPYWAARFGNSESSHSVGQAAAADLSRARYELAERLNCRPAELIFTGSGTEADNLALRGAAWAARQQGRGSHIISTSIEHSAVGNTVAQLRDLFGFDVTLVPTDDYGRVDPEEIAKRIRGDTILVSVMMVNNEVGSIQPIAEIGAICHAHGLIFHTDAIQALGHIALDVDALQVDLMALSAHKIYGPKGVGLLYARQSTPLIPPITGGPQERGRRPSTVNVAGAVAMARAVELAEADMERNNKRLRDLRDHLIACVLERIPDSRLTGHPTERVAHIASFAFKDVEGESIVVDLDLAGIAASSGAACAEGDAEPSFVLDAMGLPAEWSIGALRLSLGKENDEAQIDRVLNVLPSIITRLRARQGQMPPARDGR